MTETRWLNVRIGSWHLVAGMMIGDPWWRFRLLYNDFHANRPEGWFAIYAPLEFPQHDEHLGGPRKWTFKRRPVTRISSNSGESL
jgi:hypothetical protein